MPFFEASYIVIQPCSKGDFYSDLQNCLEQLNSVAKNGFSRIFKMNIFLYATGIGDFRVKKQFINDALLESFGEICPTFAILAQSPEKPYNLAIEIGIVDSSDLKIDYRKYKGYRYTIIEKDNYKELWANGIEDTTPKLGTESYSENAFDIMHQILLAENMTFDHIVRQWNYIGSILRTDQRENSLIQHYQIFNEVRHTYYKRYRLIPGFPAATGIGMNFNGVAIDFCAIAPNERLLVASVNNPNQINPYTYDQGVLVGAPLKGHEQKMPPQFERAKLLVYQDRAQLFVSGTASIIGQDTRGDDDVQDQTRITIQNIETLIGKKNLVHHCPPITDRNPDKYKCIRVYVKHAADIPRVKSICNPHFGNVPAIYVQADICRENLLVEIEAILCS